MIIKQHIKDDIFVALAYKQERLVISLMSESKGGSTTFVISEENTDKLKAMLFLLDTDLQKAKERQFRRSFNRGLWDEARRRSGACSWKTKEIYEQLKAEKLKINQELTHACTREEIEY